MNQVRRISCKMVSIATMAVSMTLSLQAFATGDSTGVARSYNTGDSPSPFPYWDFRSGEYKAECASGGPMVGIASSSSSLFTPTQVLCGAALTGGTSILFDQGTSTPTADENNEYFASGDSADVLSHGSRLDWDSGYYKGECPLTSLVTGIAQSIDAYQQVDTIHCSKTAAMCYQYSQAFIPTGNCHTVTLPSGGNPYWGSSWGSSAYKVSCSYGEVVAGVSVDQSNNHHPHAILCCAGTWSAC